MPSSKLNKVERDKKIPYLIILASLLLLIALFIPFRIFSPVLKSEIIYRLNQKQNNQQLTNETIPVDSDFSIIIPKISINTKVIKDVDSSNPKQYQQALTQGVAHSKSSSTPDINGNVFIFAHSAGDWYQANRYNAVFYLLKKLEKDDQIILYYNNQKYDYFLTESKIINPQDITYLNPKSSSKQLTLMTCWPPGTTLKRLIVIAKPRNNN